MTRPPSYDPFGRMRYHPAFHPNHKKPWTILDQKYLIENYVSDGPEEISFALGRTINTIMERVCALRKKGVMPKSGKIVRHERTSSRAKREARRA